LGQAHRTLQPLLGRAAATFFAVGLLAAGLASTVTGGLAGQLVIDGLLRVRLPVILRRLVSMVPAVIILAAGVGEIEALVWSQAVLCLILPATAWAVVALTSDGHLMGPFVNRRVTRMAGRLLIAALFVLNGALVVSLLL
jgi:manganese transport protein